MYFLKLSDAHFLNLASVLHINFRRRAAAPDAVGELVAEVAYSNGNHDTYWGEMAEKLHDYIHSCYGNAPTCVTM